jgi:hypothetical protein
MKKFKLVIELGNDAMQTDQDISEALRLTANSIDTGETEGKIFDVNGNVCGKFEII